MLQWMGGSRRNIATVRVSSHHLLLFPWFRSLLLRLMPCVFFFAFVPRLGFFLEQSRKSVQKRQKQYFESRKRRQQHSPASMPGFCLRDDGSRSLDILCMIDSSAQLTEAGGTFPGEKDEHANVHASSVCGGTVTHLSEIDNTEAGSPLKCQADAAYQEKKDTDLHAGKENPNAVHVMCSSFLDLLGDHLIDGSEEIKPMQEEHVAFFIEGLGTVEAETPNQSPLANSRINDIGMPRGGRALEFFTEVLELDGCPVQDLGYTTNHATFKKKHFVDDSSYGCVRNESYSSCFHPSREVCFKRRCMAELCFFFLLLGIMMRVKCLCRGINRSGTEFNKKGSPELTSWKTLIDLDNFSSQSCGSEGSCTFSAVWEEGVGNSPLGKSSKQAHKKGSSAYTCHGLGLKIPDNVEEVEDIDSNLWMHEPLDKYFGTPFVKPRRERFLDGIAQSTWRRDLNRRRSMEF